MAAKDRVERRLAAILAADVAGYSRLMSQDEVGTLRTLTAHREVMDRLIAEHGGRIANTAGDSVLAEFPSAVDAVQCAVEIQKTLADLNTGAEPDRALCFRIGVHVGDVMIRGTDLLGDGVNIAARLESLAEPGGVCISGDVYRHVRKALSFTFTDLGPQQVKNIDEPVQAFSVVVQAPLTSLAVQSKPPTRRQPLPLPDKPSIAVLPFTNLSGDPEQEYFADGMTDEITTGLSRLRWLLVIARNSTFAYKGRSVDVRQVGRELGVRYVLEGSVRAVRNRVRVSAQLIEAETGSHIWAERYDRQMDDLFALQDEITEKVVGAIEPHLYAEEGLRVSRQAPASIDTWGLVVRAIGLVSRVGRKDNEEARALLDRAVEVEPTYARAHAILGWALWWAAWNYWLDDEDAGITEARRRAETALSLDPNEPWARMVFGLCLSAERNRDQAVRELEAALRVNPSFALGYSVFGWVLVCAGRFDAAVEETGKALQLSPNDSFRSFYELNHGLALLPSRRFAEALPYLQKALVAFPDVPQQYTVLISCYGHLGQLDEVPRLLERRNRFSPQLTVSLNRHQLRDYPFGSVVAEGLSKAGVPE
ncbi:MAG TPA: adenylate/guanylate cyclase domain-containing protein [Microvirga sp.]|jgi:adenylate cyclase|nr:adenylate/guanylate cyclase domain-containing protein [Microvirga sp.]